ncbi:hypothetical protein ACN22W_18710 [Burkholderia theae]|uniref:hypothetical protein n=1 Tax=Burkholderia theae TaxID=3143496 RepID=UPI003AFA99E9
MFTHWIKGQRACIFYPPTQVGPSHSQVFRLLVLIFLKNVEINASDKMRIYDLDTMQPIIAPQYLHADKLPTPIISVRLIIKYEPGFRVRGEIAAIFALHRT